MIGVREYRTEDGVRPFARWFASLDTRVALKERTALARLEADNFSNVKGVGSGVFECRIRFGPGYRVYFGMDGRRLVILLGDGTKKRQRKDIETARYHWTNYRARKRQET